VVRCRLLPLVSPDPRLLLEGTESARRDELFEILVRPAGGRHVRWEVITEGWANNSLNNLFANNVNSDKIR
jgi:hypothetical protein